ncbi:helix-turn-helix transcriptional regulator, partial [Streptomyces sp. A7024]
PADEAGVRPALDPDALLATAATAGFLTRDPRGEVRFTAGVYATVLASTTPWPAVAAAHARLAAAVTDPIQAVRHRALATDAVDSALAADLAQAALDCRDRGDRATAAELALLAAERTPAADAEGALRHYESAAADAGRAGRLDLARRAAAAVTDRTARPAPRVHVLLAVIDAAGQALDDVGELFVRAAAEADRDPALLAAVQLRLAWKANLADGDPVRARSAASRSAALAARAGDTETAVAALTMRARLERILGDPAAEHTLAAALRDSGAPHPTGLRNQPHFLRLRHALFDDDLDRARDGLLHLLPLAERSGEAEDVIEVLRSLAETQARSGRCRDAVGYAERAARIAADAGLSPGPSWYTGALAEAAGGSFERARTLAERGVRASREEHDQVFLSRNRYALGHILLITGDPAAAAEVLLDVRELERAQRVADPSVLRWHGDLAEALAATGRQPEAAELIATTTAAARDLGRTGVLAALRRAEAAAAEPAEAERLLRSAADDFAALGLPLEHARTLWALSRTHLRLRRRAAARAALEDALAIFTEAGAAAWQALLTEALDRLLAGASGRALTDAEHRLAALVAAGASNREAAARLFLSVKTVEAMLTRIYRKLDVRSRAQLAAAWADTGEQPA